MKDKCISCADIFNISMVGVSRFLELLLKTILVMVVTSDSR